MSSALDSHLEQRISEHLDGELDDAQQAELFRALLRDPRARRMMDRYAELDRLAGSALKAAVIAPPRGLDRTILAPQKRRAIPWGQLAATAAVLAMAVGLWFMVNQGVQPGAGVDDRLATSASNTSSSPEPTGPADPATDPQRDATVSAIDRITGGIDRASMRMALTAASSQGRDDAWWGGTATDPVQDGRLVDHATAGPLIDGYQSRRRQTEQAMIGVIDLTSNRMYWFKLDQSRVASDASNFEL